MLCYRQLEVSHARNGQGQCSRLESGTCLRTSRKPVWLRPREQVQKCWKMASREVAGSVVSCFDFNSKVMGNL